MKPHSPTMTIETIGPELAADYLAQNTLNRPIRRSRVDLYASCMRRGEWEMTGEPIVFSVDGALLNGQHRLQACIEADACFQTAVVRNVADKAYDYLDSGVARTAGDVVEHAGIKNGRNLAAFSRLVIAFDEGVVHSHSTTRLVATRTAIKSEIEKHNDLYQRAHGLAQQAARNRGHIMSAFGSFYVLAVKRFGDLLVDDYIEPLVTGANLNDGDPRLALLNQMMGPNRPRGNVEALALLIRTWNAWRAGEKRRMIKGWSRSTPYPAFDDEPAR